MLFRLSESEQSSPCGKVVPRSSFAAVSTCSSPETCCLTSLPAGVGNNAPRWVQPPAPPEPGDKALTPLTGSSGRHTRDFLHDVHLAGRYVEYGPPP